MEETGLKLVEFENYCKKCKHEDKTATDEPCNHCLTVPARENSHKPENFIEDETKCGCKKKGNCICQQ